MNLTTTPHWWHCVPLLAGLLAVSTPANALDLSAATAAALANDAGIQAARFSTESQLERLPMAKAQLLPNVTLSGSVNNNQLESTTNFGVSDDSYVSRNLTLAVRQPLYRPNLWKGMEQAQSMVEDASAVLRVEEQNLMMKVAAAYFDALQTEDQLKLLEAQRTLTLSQLDAARKALAAGTGTRTDIDEAQARLDMAQAQVLEARQNADFTRRTLSAMVQQPADVLATLDPNRLDLQALNPTDLQAWLDDAQNNSPELQALTARVRSAELEVDKATAGHKPTLDAVAQLSSSESENVTRLFTKYKQQSLGVQFNLPLYAGGYISAQVRSAIAEASRARMQLEATRRDLHLRVQREHRGITENASKIQALQQAERSTAQLIESTRMSHKAGVRTVIDILNAELQHLLVKRDLAQARHLYTVSLVRLWALTGQALPEKIATINGWLAQPTQPAQP